MRCATADNKFDPDRFRRLLEIADSWETPLIVNRWDYAADSNAPADGRFAFRWQVSLEPSF